MVLSDSTDNEQGTQLAKLKGASNQVTLASKALEEIILDLESPGPAPAVAKTMKVDGGEYRSFFIPASALQEMADLSEESVVNLGSLVQKIYWDIYSFSYFLSMIGQDREVSGAVISSIAVKVDGSLQELFRVSNLMIQMRAVDCPPKMA